MHYDNVKKIRAVIQAGGKGTRMQEITKDIIPKPMLEIDGKPIILWQMENISRYGIRDFVIVTGHLGEIIESFFGNGSEFGFKINYIKEETPMGSAGALGKLVDYPADIYLLIFGDVVFDIDIDRLLNFHLYKNARVTLLVHPNSHPFDSDIVSINSNYQVDRILSKNEKRNDYYHNCVNAGIYVLDRSVVFEMNYSGKMDMEKDVLIPLIKNGQVFAYSTSEYVKDSGTPERFITVSKEKEDGVWERKSLRNKQRAIFMDRDGTLNKFKNFITDSKQIELEENVAEAVKLINGSGYLAIVITNQPVIARGECTEEELQNIHNKIETLLGEEGAFLDAIYYCPHHPDKGFSGERIEYKIKCECRKPGIGLINKAIEEFNINVAESYIIGDTTGDVMTGVNAGLHTVLVHTGEKGNDKKYDVMPEMEAEDLLDAVRHILKGATQ